MIKKSKLNVKIATINAGQPTQYHILCSVQKNGKYEELVPLQYAPSWKTLQGAARYAQKNGYNLVQTNSNKRQAISKAQRAAKKKNSK